MKKNSQLALLSVIKDPSRYYQDSSVKKLILYIQRNLVDSDINRVAGVKRLQQLLSRMSYDTFTVDDYYNLPC